MEVLYIAGKYRAKTAWELEQNIRLAELRALHWARQGYAVICPHKNTAHMDGSLPDEYWLAATMEMMRRCDVVVMIPNWHESAGALKEHAEALRLGMRVIYECPCCAEAA
jgi:hypothetical protein